jgi:hypothetical protein
VIDWGDEIMEIHGRAVVVVYADEPSPLLFHAEGIL